MPKYPIHQKTHVLCAFERIKTVFRTLGTGFCVFTDALSHATRKRRVLYSASRQRLVLLYLTTLLVSNSYSPELNPGPSTDHSSSPANSQSRFLSQTHSSWICGTCALACIGTIGGWFATSVANGFTDSARVWTPSTMVC